MTTAIGPVNTPPVPTPPSPRPLDDSRADFAAFLAPFAWFEAQPAAAPSGQPPAGDAHHAAQESDGPGIAQESSARSSAQVLTSGHALTASAAASQRLFEGHGSEKPNEVNLAGRAAAELASRGQTTPGDQPAAETAVSRADSRRDGARPDAPLAEASSTRQAAMPDASRTQPTPSQPIAGPSSAGPVASSAHSPTSAVASVAPAQAATPGATAPRQNTTPISAASPAATAPVASAQRSAGADAQSARQDGSAAAAARARMWARLERMGQRPPAPANAAAPPRSADRAAEAQSTVQAQLARGLAAALRQRDGHLTLRLSPESLGHLRVDLAIQADRVSASIAAADQQARRLLSNDLVSLRAALEASGLNVEHIEVVEAPAEPTRQPEPVAQPTSASASRPDAAASPSDDQPRQQHGRGHADAHGSPSRHADPGADSTAGTLAADLRADPGSSLDSSSSHDLYVLRIDLIA